jgi:hypothetical protein
MAFSRYQRDFLSSDGKNLFSSSAITILRAALRDGLIYPKRSMTVTASDRLDTIAGQVYGDARYWWILAVASDIGWGLQVPPGTVIKVLDLSSVERLVG